MIQINSETSASFKPVRGCRRASRDSRIAVKLLSSRPQNDARPFRSAKKRLTRSFRRDAPHKTNNSAAKTPLKIRLGKRSQAGSGINSDRSKKETSNIKLSNDLSSTTLLNVSPLSIPSLSPIK